MNKHFDDVDITNFEHFEAQRASNRRWQALVASVSETLEERFQALLASIPPPTPEPIEEQLVPLVAAIKTDLVIEEKPKPRRIYRSEQRKRVKL